MSKITATEKHIPNLVRSEDKEARDNVSSNVLLYKKEIETNDKVVSTAEKNLTLPKTVISENEKNGQNEIIFDNVLWKRFEEFVLSYSTIILC